MTVSLIFFSAISGAALICYAVLLLITVRNGLLQHTHRYFALYLAGMMVWSFGALMMYVDRGDAEIWNRMMMAGVAVTPLAFYGFVQGFLGRRGADPYSILGAVALVAALVLNSLGLLVEDISVEQSGLIRFTFGSAMPLFGAYYLFFQFMAAHHLLHDYTRAVDFDLRNRIKYILLGWMLIMIGGVTNVLPIAGTMPIDITFNLINALLITYTISRYHLLDLTLIVRQGLVYSVSTGLVVIGYLLIVFLGVDLLGLVGGTRITLALVVAFLVAILLEPRREGVQNWVDRRLFREKYDAAVMLQRLSRQVASVLNLEQLAGLILDEITSTMQPSQVALIIRDRETNAFAPLAERGFEGKLTLTFQPDSPIVNWLATRDDVLTAADFSLQPQFKGLWAQERADLASLRIELFIGLRVGGDLVGILVLGPKRSGFAYTPDEQRTLETLANQTAVAVQNAWLYGAALDEKDRAQTILRAAFAGVIVVDDNLRIVTMNPSAESITGHELSDLRNQPLTAVLGHDLAGQGQALSRVMTAGVPLSPTEVTLQANGQRRDLLFSVTPFHDGYLVNFADITQLKEVDRLKSDIIANVSHELRSPLASIKGYTELLLEDMEGQDRELRHQFLSVINEETDRLSTFINEMLDLARLESGHIQLDLVPIPIGAFIIDVARSLKYQADSADVTIQTEIADDLPPVLIDSSWMYSAIKNLISNAIKFSPRGAGIEIVASQRDLATMIEVIDHGPGIAPEDLPHLFTKFYRGAAARQLGISGSGVGLVLAKQAIELHHGTLTVCTSANSGARFIVTLPAAGTHKQQVPEILA